MMHLRDDLSERFSVDLDQLEEQLQMPYVTSIERLAIKKGKAGVILSVLERHCGPLPSELEDRIGALSLDQLEQLQGRMFDFQSTVEVEGWLDRHSDNVQSDNVV